MNAWEAARVTRKHTMVNIRAENIAEHTWGVVHILYCLWPSAPSILVKAAHYHDIGEFATGDLPAQVKWANDEIRELTDRLALEGARRCLPEPLHNCLSLTEAEMALIEVCDKAEFCFSCYYETMLGNRHVVKMFHRNVGKIEALYEKYRSEFEEMSPSLLENIRKLRMEIVSMGQKMGEPI